MAEPPVVAASRRPRAGRKPKTFGESRVCLKDDCVTRLSRYNRQEFCSVHTRVRYPRVRGADPVEG